MQFGAPGDERAAMLAAAGLGLGLAGLKRLAQRIWEALTIGRGYYPLTWQEWAGGYLDFTAPEKMLEDRERAKKFFWLLFGCEFAVSAVLLWILIPPNSPVAAMVQPLHPGAQPVAMTVLSVLAGLALAWTAGLVRAVWEAFIFRG
ncbi:MAG: hypothetical protein ACPLRW_06630 [Moorellales bacterium]